MLATHLHRRNKRDAIFASFFIWLLVASAPLASAQNFNVDFGIEHGIPSSAFGAAASQPGFWNNFSAQPIAQPLSNLAGNPTTVMLGLTADDYNGFSGTSAAHTGDFLALLDDNFYSNDTHPWLLSISGLSNGTYDFYYYGTAMHLLTRAHSLSNGIAAASIPGSTSNTFDQGVDWQVLPGVSVVDGMLTVIPTTTDGFRGLAGFQVVVVPEPSSLRLCICGGLVAFALSARR